MATKRSLPKPSAQPPPSSSDEESDQEAAPSPMEDEAVEEQQQGGGSSSGDEEGEGSGSSSGDEEEEASGSKPKLLDSSIKPNNSKNSPPFSPNAEAKASARKTSNGRGTKRKLFEKPPPPSSSPNDAKDEEEEDDDDDFVYLREAINRSDNKRIKAYVEKGLPLVDRSEAKKLDREFRQLWVKEKYYDIVWYRMVKEALKLYLEANGKSGWWLSLIFNCMLNFWGVSFGV